MKKELVKLYKEYLLYLDKINHFYISNHLTPTSPSFAHFMMWLEEKNK